EQYSNFSYEEPGYQAYSEFRNEDWFNRQIGSKLNVGFGATFGWLFPDGSPDQTFEQALVRGIYRLTGKVDVRASAGVEFRQYESGLSGTINPVFSISGIYQPTVSTTITLEAHERVEASPFQDYNTTVIGAYAGVRQQLFSRLYAGLVFGYDNIAYE